MSLPRFPFDPARLPVFYGWCLVPLCAGTILASSPGQTTGVSAFVEPLLDLSGLDRASFSTTYLFGTLASGFCLATAGRWVDRFGPRVMLTIACVLLGILLLAMSAIDHAAVVWTRWLGIASESTVYAVLLTGGFAGLRFAGQGLMVICCQTTLGHWFRRRRGIASAINGAVLAVAGNATPLLFIALIAATSWSHAWLWSGLVVGVGWALVVALFWRDQPEPCGLHPDGLPPVANADGSPVIDEAWTRDEALRTRAFWTVVGCGSLLGLIITSVTFHLADIGRGAGLDGPTAHAFLLVIGSTALPAGLIGGTLADRIAPRWLCVVLSGGLLIHLLSMPFFGPGLAYVIPGLAIGIAAGLAGPMAIATLPRFFGRRHLGAINGLYWATTVIASAIGPVAYALAREHFTSYTPTMMVLMIPVVGLFLSSWTLRPPQRPAVQ